MRDKKVVTELYRLGELPRGWDKKINSETIDEQVEEITQSDQEILEKYKPSLMAEAIEQKRKATRKEENIRKFPKTLGYLTAAAAAMFVISLILPNLISEPSTYNAQETTRIKGKGESELKIYRQKGEITEILGDQSLAGEGDLLQLGYRVTPTMCYSLIVSVDGRGTVTRHLAPEGEVTEKQIPGVEHLLTYSYELDDAPEYETFYLVVSDRPFPVDPVVDLLAREARSDRKVLDIPEIIQTSSLNPKGLGTIHQYALLIRKEE